MNKVETNISVSGMTCGHCVKNVEKLLKGVSGVENVSVSLENKNALVLFDADHTNALSIAAALDGSHYKVTAIE